MLKQGCYSCTFNQYEWLFKSKSKINHNWYIWWYTYHELSNIQYSQVGMSYIRFLCLPNHWHLGYKLWTDDPEVGLYSGKLPLFWFNNSKWQKMILTMFSNLTLNRQQANMMRLWAPWLNDRSSDAVLDNSGLLFWFLLWLNLIKNRFLRSDSYAGKSGFPRFVLEKKYAKNRWQNLSFFIFLSFSVNILH